MSRDVDASVMDGISMPSYSEIRKANAFIYRNLPFNDAEFVCQILDIANFSDEVSL